MEKSLYTSNLRNYKKIYQGKVRDVYEVDDENLLIVTTDRISVFDTILPTPIPNKGKILNRISLNWFERYKNIIENHLAKIKIDDLNISKDECELIKERSIVVKKCKAIPAEAIVRGYIIGSGYKEYKETGSICDIELPKNLRISSKFESPIFTPSTKANVGDHDENISYKEFSNLIGDKTAKQIKDISLEIFNDASEYLIGKNIILADTKFEFGITDESKLVLIDEILTPDSSRFWPLETYSEGENPISLDKQYIRDYIKNTSWKDGDAIPDLPDEVVRQTMQKYEDLENIIFSWG